MLDISDKSTSSEEGGWRPTDLTDGPVYATNRALRQIRTGGCVGALWGVVLLSCVGLRYAGVPSWSSVYWDLGGGIALLVCALGAAARSPVAMGVLSLLAAGDVAVQVLALREALGHSAPAATALATARLSALPVIVYMVARGYTGAVDYRLLRGGARPKNWRFWAPVPFIGGFLAYLGVVLFVALFWKGALQHMFGQPGARLRGQDKVATPLMRGLYADLNSIDVKPFREGEAAEDDATTGSDGRSNDGSGKDRSRAAMPPFTDLDSLPKPVRDTVEEAFRFAAGVDQAGCYC